MSTHRPRVLISAFACEPGRGSEQEVGWRWALEMSLRFDVTVITQTRNRPGIDRELARSKDDRRMLQFEYHQLPNPIYRLKSRFDPLTWPYYIIWQWTMMRTAERLHLRDPFNLAHHVTFVSFRVPIWLKRLGIPVVFGPVGGAERAPLPLLMRGFGPLLLCKELLRNFTTAVCSYTIRLLPPVLRHKGICLAATPAMAGIFTKALLPNRVLPAIGVDRHGHAARHAPPAIGGIRFLFVGRFHPLKGVRLLLDAFAEASIPNSSLTLIGGEADNSEFLRYAENLGIQNHLKWVARIPREQLPGHYSQHHVLVAPSLYESGGLTALEAMAEGLPVVVLDVGGHSTSVSEECGIKVPTQGSIQDVIDRLAQAMRRYADDPDLIRRHGDAARQQVFMNYGWDRKSEIMTGIYNELLAHPKDVVEP
jgi:glycosyltransferase involved in cell wall biosynthesis